MEAYFKLGVKQLKKKKLSLTFSVPFNNMFSMLKTQMFHVNPQVVMFIFTTVHISSSLLQFNY